MENLKSESRRSLIATFLRVFKYALVKAITLFLTVAIGLYLTITVINMGGYVDKMIAAMIDESIGGMIQGGWLKDVPEPERTEMIDQTREAMQHANGLDQPYLLRSLRWLGRGLTLNLGESRAVYFYSSDVGDVKTIVFRHLPYTLALVGAANILVFFASITLALVLSRKPGSLADRAVMVLSPLSTMPSWIFGILLTLIFAIQLKLLPVPRAVEIDPNQYSLYYFLVMLKYMILPMFAIFLSTFFIGVYSWRTFFLIYSTEDYVEVARAKGLPDKIVERQYILRPVLPYVITSFAVMVLSLWQGAIALELLFKWPGVGTLFMTSVRSFNTPLTIGIVVIFAYLLAVTVFLLDIVYALVDPRVKIGGERQSARSVRIGPRRLFQRRSILPAQDQGLQENRLGPGRSFQARTPVRVMFPELWSAFRASLKNQASSLRVLSRYPSAVVGLVVILALALLALATLVAYPHREVIELWRAQGGDLYRATWYRNPKNALPAWVNIFRREDLPETIIQNSQDGSAEKTVRAGKNGASNISINFTFDYAYDEPPQDLVIFLESQFTDKPPFAALTWVTPDGKEIDLGGQSIKGPYGYYISRDEKLARKLRTDYPLDVLFASAPEDGPALLQGTYQLKLTGVTFEPGSDLDAEMVVYGHVQGLAGTDNQRRDLLIPLLWGIPVALSFGLLGAIGTSLVAMTIAAIGVWNGGWLDELIQRITEVNMILPALPIAILVFVLFSKSIWAILGVLVLLNIFGSAIKNYRAVFLQVKHAPYVEAAQTYGASNWRIISRYLTPRIMPVLIPQLVMMVPVFVFYEATLAYLGVSDPNLPTWGKTIFEALSSSNFMDYSYWFLEPIALMFITSLAFLMVGFALEKIFNPRLYEM